ncbi:type VI secretion system lipoprotein TssJ [Dyella sp. M7H15-1]|uniref:type VI secretion system lipoprotein TssJ n=1 Tax=Dyella sp. M7H15-1 TaxID=2501295 RepID=UPI001004FB8F|nr:type VI secretion system lipoprotein TssJ [Dyella sp. M7H15-1]QAU23837.1 type VI secretion system lipoprotein TssJ [Dyella sp. M7H15-1]
MKPFFLTIAVLLALTALLLTGCGAWQTTKDTSTDVSRAIFVAKVKQMHLVIEGRAELNRDERGASLPVAMRVYQLKDAKAFEQATYAQLLHDADRVLKADALSHTDIVLAPQATITLNTPMADNAQYVGVVAFFRDPSHAAWRLVMPKAQWKKTDPVTLSVIGNTLEREGDAP